MRNQKCKCDICHIVFDSDELEKDFIDGGYHGEPHYTCPYCGSEEWEYVEECCRCGEYFLYDDDIYGTSGSMICRKCIDKEMTVENVIDYGNERTDEISLNGLFIYVYSDTEINEILKREFMKLPEEKRNQYIKDYVECDLHDFADWVES